VRYEITIIVFGLGALAVAFFATFIVRLVAVEHPITTNIERLGRFVRQTGVNERVRIPFYHRIIAGVDPRLEQLNFAIEGRTKDDVFVPIAIALQYYFLADTSYNALYKYKLGNANEQITSFVFDVVCIEVSKIKYDDLSENKHTVANTVTSELARVIKGFGYGILKSLDIHIVPAYNSKFSMIDIKPKPSRGDGRE